MSENLMKTKSEQLTNDRKAADVATNGLYVLLQKRGLPKGVRKIAQEAFNRAEGILTNGDEKHDPTGDCVP